MKKVVLTVAIAAAALSGVAAVATAQTHTRAIEGTTVTRPNGTQSRVELLKTGKHLETVSCRDYNMLEETYRPQAVVYAANYGPMGKAHPTVTTEGIERFIPVVTASCRARPGDHFTNAVNRAMIPSK